MSLLARGSSSGIVSHILTFSNINGISPHPPFLAKIMTFKSRTREETVPLPASPQSPSKALGFTREPFRISSGTPRLSILHESADVGSKQWGRGLQSPFPHPPPSCHHCLAAGPRKTARHTMCHIQSVDSCLPTFCGEPPSTTHLLLLGMVKIPPTTVL